MHNREVKSLSVASPARLVLILRSQREQILPLSRLDVKIFKGCCPSCKFTKVDTYGYRGRAPRRHGKRVIAAKHRAVRGLMLSHQKFIARA